MNENNLIPLNERDPEERRAIAAAGGKASAEARQQRKTLRAELLLILDSGNYRERIATALIGSALTGNVSAVKELSILVGERAEETERSVSAALLTIEEKRKLFKEMLNE